MTKDAKTSLPIHDLLKKRWSPRAFLDKPVEKEIIIKMFEAARWSASGGNEQPWRFIVGAKPDETWNKIYSALDPGNAEWNAGVPLLILACANRISSWDGNESPFFKYDAGQAVAYLTIEALHCGIHVHQMGGFNPDKAREIFGIPPDFSPLTVIAAGYLGNPESLSEKLKAREISERQRKALSDLVFSSTFGKTSDLI